MKTKKKKKKKQPRDLNKTENRKLKNKVKKLNN